MKKFVVLLIGALVTVVLPAAVTGDYLEVRTSDIYTGPCFANAEVNLTGKEAIMAWRVQEGKWNGVELDGLSVVAVVQADATLGDPFVDARTTRAVLLVDQYASSGQRAALTEFARSMAPDLLSEVVRVESAPIELRLGDHGEASLTAGDVAEIQTRGLHEGDHICGNEIVYYPPLASTEAHPAYTRVHRFSGSGLDSTWSSPFKRSAFVGTFSR